MNSNLTLNVDLLANLPLLEILQDGQEETYQTESIVEGSILFVNLRNVDKEFYVTIKEFLPEIDKVGIVLNFDEYFDSLQEASIQQEVIDYQTNKRISSY